MLNVILPLVSDKFEEIYRDLWRFCPLGISGKMPTVETILVFSVVFST